MEELVTIAEAPNRNIAFAGDLALEFYYPYSVARQFVTIHVSQNNARTEDKEREGAKKPAGMSHSKKAMILIFDFNGNTRQEINLEKTTYIIQLMAITEEETDNGRQPCCEFLVSTE